MLSAEWPKASCIGKKRKREERKKERKEKEKRKGRKKIKKKNKTKQNKTKKKRTTGEYLLIVFFKSLGFPWKLSV